jgi:cytochrome oxidase Cu insertion factor (SCO1/SenC/PrrC family)
MRGAIQPTTLLLLALSSASCKESATTTTTSNTTSTPAPNATTSPAVVSPPSTNAVVGKPAPDFALKDLDGNVVSLAKHKGKIVVLEWFNPECPFVNRAHNKGSLKGMASRLKDKVVWIAVNSAASGKQGFGPEKNRTGAKSFGMDHSIVLDESGQTGRAYGATNTPHMYVIDKDGVLVYRGAIDNSPDAEGESPAGGKLVNYVEAALADLAAGRPVGTSETKAYGCTVKY